MESITVGRREGFQTVSFNVKMRLNITIFTVIALIRRVSSDWETFSRKIKNQCQGTDRDGGRLGDCFYL